MVISTLAQQLCTCIEIKQAFEALARGEDCTLEISQSARTLILAALWALQPRPYLYVVAGDEACERAASMLAGWLGAECVCTYPNRSDMPWSDECAPAAVVAARTKALHMLAAGTPCIVVASARSLLRRLPPTTSVHTSPFVLALADEHQPSDVARTLLAMGYERIATPRDLTQPGMFCLQGDRLDIFSATEQTCVRIEFFGNEIDSIRSFLPATGQTIAPLETLEVFACKEVALTPETIAHARTALFDRAQEDAALQTELEHLENGCYTAYTDALLCELYGASASPIDYIDASACVVLAEPRALFDDCQHAYDDIEQRAQNARASMQGLYTPCQQLDFGSQQRFSMSSFARVGAKTQHSVVAEQPHIAGSQTKLIERIRQLFERGMHVVFAVPNRDAQHALELSLSDEGISFTSARELEDAHATRLPAGRVVFLNDAIHAGVIIPKARLAVLSIGDLSIHINPQHHRFQCIDPVQLTFPFKPGDYVVHATHGIALLKKIVRQDVGGKPRDYFLLIYANDDKLYVPFEQVDRLTRYIGPDASHPRLTRLNCADWSRACSRARASAKKLAFDLVDLYTRRQTVHGYGFSYDNQAQRDMEASFPYTLTSDQERALADIKADMEQAKPMDRLLCGDVGFGKTEVALRAAFKCCQDGKQVMVLCPTTILAQQHFETFFERFTPFDLCVRVLSRFISPAEQRRALEGFSAGDVDVLIGTHRLLSSDVNPANLGLVIIDEEQRFGVQHKEQLKTIREQVDVLTLSATPIPRTMQMAMSGVRDMSLILTPPPGRKPVIVHVGEWDADVISDAIRFELARSGQVYYVSNRVATIDQAIERVRSAAPEARVGVAHGQMSAAEIEDVMLSFAEREIDVLVATTIIESGIDNPHTNTLIIEDAQRLGLAQLYQLKGRVGRGRLQAYAYIMFPETQPLTDEARRRLEAIYEHQELGSGMRIAMKDLEIRGAGSLVGAEQHGNLSSVGFDLFTHMLSEAVRDIRGQCQDDVASDVVINISAPFYFDEAFIPEVDVRVVWYRRLAYATDIETIDELEKTITKECGDMEEPAQNLFDRARIRVYATQLGITTVAVAMHKLTLLGIEVPYKRAVALRAKRVIVYPKTKKLVYPLAASGVVRQVVLHLKELSDHRG